MKRRLVLKLLSVLFFVSLVPTVALGQDLPTVGSYSDEIAKAKADGIDMNPADLQPPMPPESENAAPIYAKLGELIAKHKADVEDAHKFMDSMNDFQPSKSDMIRAKSIIEPLSDMLTLIHKADRLPKCVFLHDWSKGRYTVDIPEIDTFEQAQTLLTVESLAKGGDGDLDGAIAECGEIFDIANQASTDVHIIATAKCALDAQGDAIGALMAFLYISNGDANVISKIQNTIATKYVAVNMDPVYRAEMLPYTQTDMEEFGNFTSVHEPKSFKQRLMQYEGPSNTAGTGYLDYFRLNYPTYLSRMRVALHVANAPLNDVVALGSQLIDEYKTADPSIYLEAEVIPSILNLSIDRSGIVCYARLLRLACEVLKYYNANSCYPADVTQLDGPPAMDPLGDGSLKYRQLDGGFVVYSVGLNGDNDPQDSSKKNDDHNPTLFWPLPPFMIENATSPTSPSP